MVIISLCGVVRVSLCVGFGVVWWWCDPLTSSESERVRERNPKQIAPSFLCVCVQVVVCVPVVVWVSLCVGFGVVRVQSDCSHTTTTKPPPHHTTK